MGLKEAATVVMTLNAYICKKVTARSKEPASPDQNARNLREKEKEKDKRKLAHGSFSKGKIKHHTANPPCFDSEGIQQSSPFYLLSKPWELTAAGLL